MELRYDNAFGAVDNERTAGGHIRNHTQVYVLDNGFEIFVFDIVTGEFEFCLQRNAVRQTSLKALVHAIARSVDIVIKEFKDEAASCIRNGEILRKCAVEAFVATAFGIRVNLKEFLKRLELDIQEVRICHLSCGCKAYSVIIISCQGYNILIQRIDVTGIVEYLPVGIKNNNKYNTSTEVEVLYY